MKLIRCQNHFKDKKNGKCGRILGVLTDTEIEMLKIDPEDGPVFRCPQCPAEQRWSRVSMNKNSGLVFTTIDPPEDLPEEAVFDDLIIFEQVG